MNNFFNFITEDIETKKTLLSVMPTKTKTNIKKFNEKIEEIQKNYSSYELKLKKFIFNKKDSIKIPIVKKDIEKYEQELKKVKDKLFLLDRNNTYIEKMGFDVLLFEMKNYYTFDFDFQKLNEIVTSFVNKFKIAKINLNSAQFKYTPDVYEYMKVFFEKKEDIEELSKAFERLYWDNPNIIKHFELSMMKILKKHKSELKAYIQNEQFLIRVKNKAITYSKILRNFFIAYDNLNSAKEENINDIINKSITGEIDITKHFKNSKFYDNAYKTITISNLDFSNKEISAKLINKLKKLNDNLEEYNIYYNLRDIINYFRETFEELTKKGETSNSIKRKIATNNRKIKKDEIKLKHLSKMIIKKRTFLKKIKSKDIKEYGNNLQILADELYTLYEENSQFAFYLKNLELINENSTISKYTEIYCYFEYFKLKAIMEVFKETSYQKILEISKQIDDFALNPRFIITKSLNFSEEKNLAEMIVNKYRIENINLTKDELQLDNIDLLHEKIIFIIRNGIMESNNLTPEQIWFVSKVEKYK